MYCALLLEMEIITEAQRDKLDNFLKIYLPNGYVTVSRTVEYTGIAEEIIIEVFSTLYMKNFLDIVYAVKCPVCGHIIKKIIDINCFDYEALDYCYSCDESIDLSDDDLIVFFTQKHKSPFDKGQHWSAMREINESNVAHNDSTKYLKSICESFNGICNYYNLKSQSEKRAELNASVIEQLKDKAFSKYKRNRKNRIILNIASRLISFIILCWILILSELQGNITVLVTVIIYVIQNVIDVILKSIINTDLSYLEREELFQYTQQKKDKLILHKNADISNYFV